MPKNTFPPLKSQTSSKKSSQRSSHHYLHTANKSVRGLLFNGRIQYGRLTRALAPATVSDGNTPTKRTSRAKLHPAYVLPLESSDQLIPMELPLYRFVWEHFLPANFLTARRIRALWDIYKRPSNPHDLMYFPLTRRSRWRGWFRGLQPWRRDPRPLHHRPLPRRPHRRWIMYRCRTLDHLLADGRCDGRRWRIRWINVDLGDGRVIIAECGDGISSIEFVSVKVEFVGISVGGEVCAAVDSGAERETDGYPGIEEVDSGD